MKRDKHRPSLLRTAFGGRFGLVLLSLIGMIVVAPQVDSDRVSVLVLSLCSACLIVGCLHASKPGSRPFKIGVVLAVVEFVLGRIAMNESFRGVLPFQIGFWVFALGYVILVLIEHIFERAGVDLETFQAAICVYLLIGLVWGYLYALIDLYTPSSFLLNGQAHLPWQTETERIRSFMKMLLLSYAKLSGSGNSDLTAHSNLASILGSFEAMMGQVYLAVVIARLVSMQVSKEMTPSGPSSKASVD
jgi:hypothetical protein